MKSSLKQRLDLVLVEKKLVNTRDRAKALILAGKIRVDGVRVCKAGALVSPDAEVLAELPDFPYVSRGALKLKAALDQLEMDVKGMICMDVGASTGGFTDLLLRSGASRVYAVDVGYGQLAWSLRQDSRVVVLERCNIRYLEHEIIPEAMDLITIDTSFISLRLVVPACKKFLASNARLLALIKPQFEAGKGEVGKGGVVKDPEKHKKVIQDLTMFFEKEGLFPGDAIPSPIKGPKGNQEFILPLWTNKEQKLQEKPNCYEIKESRITEKQHF